jgi:hypothetical protein
MYNIEEGQPYQNNLGTTFQPLSMAHEMIFVFVVDPPKLPYGNVMNVVLKIDSNLQ